MQDRTENGGSRHLPLAMELQFKVPSPRGVAVGAGRTVLMSSKEVVFTTDRVIPPGTELELAIAWPALLQDHIGLQLIVSGPVIGVEGESITLLIRKYQFRTRALAGEPRVSKIGVAVAPFWRAAREAHV